MNRITTARFTDITAETIAVVFETVLSVSEGCGARLIAGGETLASARAFPTPDRSNRAAAIFTLPCGGTPDITLDYELSIDGARYAVPIEKTALIDDRAFIAAFEKEDTLSLEYGALYTEKSTVFRVWAPFASAVMLKLYGVGAPEPIPMQKRVKNGVWGGVWELAERGDLNGVYYNYIVTNNGRTKETIDPYAKACNANGTRGMVIDLAEASPEGWADDRHLYATDPESADTPIVWEVHVSDFSASADSGMKYKGKYLAFTERGTVVPGDETLKTGVDYLKELGVTYVHLNPVYDFATVDESELTRADNTKDSFNWGYDPQNYNIPEGSYSTDPDNGSVRVTEFKQMVAALHSAGIGVIMDVVYNHTYSKVGQALHDTVPFYYHRTDRNGAFTDLSGCGNDIASERAMARKYIIDSLVYWATEYHIDGFRFDLMGIHDLFTVERARAALDALDGGNGKRILMYGEPWTGEFGSDVIPASHSARIEAAGEAGNALVKKCDLSTLPERVAVFNDVGRNALRGNNDLGAGWLQGDEHAAKQVAALMNGAAKGLGLGSRNVAYAAAHDNYTLWDQLTGKRAGTETPLCYESALPHNVKRCELAAAAYLMSPGICLILAGEEMGRTKYGNENSYNSPNKLNRIVWSRQKEFKALKEFYAKMIALRKAHRKDLFSYAASTDPSFTRGGFTANGLRIGGSRGALSVELDASALCGYVKIGSKKVEIT